MQTSRPEMSANRCVPLGRQCTGNPRFLEIGTPARTSELEEVESRGTALPHLRGQRHSRPDINGDPAARDSMSS